MHFEEVVRGRRSIRTYSDKPVPRKVIEELILDASWAPSACNRQLWHFIVMKKDVFEKKLGHVCPTIAAIAPPVVIFAVYHRRYNSKHSANIQSIAAAVQNILLSAYNKGLGSLWMTDYGRENDIKRILNIPKAYTIAAAICLGYSNQNDTTPARRPLSEIAHFGKMINIRHIPFCWDPDYWSKEDIVNAIEYSVRAKSPSDRFYRPFIEAEFKNQIEHFPAVRGRTLVFNPFSGNYLFQLISKGKIDGAIDIFGLSKNVNMFIENKRQNLGIAQKFTYANGLGQMPYPNDSFDSIICAEQLERFRDKQEIISDFRRVLKDNGKLYIIFNNSLSIYYVLWRIAKIVKRPAAGVRGPFKPVSPFTINGLLKDFVRKKCVGFTILPTCNLQKYHTKAFFRLFCKSWLMVFETG
jgi:nitroreductase/SAM-dependent methyltransferase